MKHNEHQRDIRVAMAISSITRPFSPLSLMTLWRLTDYDAIPLLLRETIAVLGPIGMQFREGPKLNYDHTGKLIHGTLAVTGDDGTLQEKNLVDLAIDIADNNAEADFFHLDEAIDTIAWSLFEHFSLDMDQTEISNAIYECDPNKLAKIGKAIHDKMDDDKFADTILSIVDRVSDEYMHVMFDSEERTVVGSGFAPAEELSEENLAEIEVGWALNGAFRSMEKLAQALNLLCPVLMTMIPHGGLGEFFRIIKLIEVVQGYRQAGADDMGHVESVEELAEAIENEPNEYFFDYAIPDPELIPSLASILYAQFLESYEPISIKKTNMGLALSVPADVLAKILRGSSRGGTSSNLPS